jgi:uncharacterized protein YbjQ (UPF0145 family)
MTFDEENLDPHGECAAEIKRLRTALEEIRNTAFYHMTRHADQRGDRAILGEIKERSIVALNS